MGNFSTWMVGAERLLEDLPGVLSASLEGDFQRATEVRLLVGEDPPVSKILEAARAALEENIDECPFGSLFRIQVQSVDDQTSPLDSRVDKDPPAASPDTPDGGSIKLITHHVRDVSPGVVGVELTLGLLGRRFAGGASGKADSPGRNRVPALATLSALGSCIRFASEGAGVPTLELESVSEFSLGGSRVAVVVITMSGHGAPLIASWPLAGASGPAVVRATLEAAARRVTRLSKGGTEQLGEATEPIESSAVAGSGGMLRQRAESLLESEEAIASARIVLDEERGFRIHVLATSEKPRWEVAQTVMTLLEAGLGLQVRADQVTVVQSRLSADDLNRLLSGSSTSPPVTADSDLGHGGQAPSGGALGRRMGGAGPAGRAVSRLTLVDFHIVVDMMGKQEVGVRIVRGSRSVDGRCRAPKGGFALLRPLADATLDAVGAFVRQERQIGLVLKDVRRFRRRGDQGVMVLVEAIADGRKTLLSGAAFSADSFERAAVVAVLQATNGLVAGVMELGQSDHPRIDPLPPPDQPSGWRTDPSRRTDSSRPSDSSGPSDSDPSDPAVSPPSETMHPDDYVSEVLSRIQSTRGLDPASPSS